MSADRSTEIDRRHLIAATVGGALVGSAWGLALGRTASDPNTPTVTVTWSRSGFAALLDYHRRRLLVLDADTPDRQDQLSQQVTGFMRQRIDVLLATERTLATLPVTARSRWRISDVLALDPDTAHPQIGVTGRQLEIDDLVIAFHRTHRNGWSHDAGTSPGWYIDARRKASRLVITGRSGSLEDLFPAAGLTTALVVLDEDLSRLPPILGDTIIAAPETAPMFDDTDVARGKALRLYRDSPVQFALPGDGVVIPSN